MSNHLPLGFFQRPLSDGELVRLIYTDEAGSSEREQVLVIAAVVVHGDKQVRMLENEIARIIEEKVPEQLRDGFYIHAKDIYHGGKAVPRDIWDREERLDFLKEIGCLPFVHDIPIALATSFKTYDWAKTIPEVLEAVKLNSHQWTHVNTFGLCMERADHFIRQYLRGTENGMIIAEDIPDMKRHISKYGLLLRGNPVKINTEHMRRESWESQFDIEHADIEYKIDHILEVPHFVQKSDCKLIQLADVIAFSFRRCLEKQRDGDDLVQAILGPSVGGAFINEPAWFTFGSSAIFNTDSFVDTDVLMQREFRRGLAAGRIRIVGTQGDDVIIEAVPE